MNVQPSRSCPPTTPTTSVASSGRSLSKSTTTSTFTKTHHHPINYPLWGFKVAVPPFTGSPKAFPQHSRVRLWPAVGFTVDVETPLGPCGKAVPIFASAELQDDGGVLLGPCFYHRANRTASHCKNKDVVIPLKVGPRLLPQLIPGWRHIHEPFRRDDLAPDHNGELLQGSREGARSLSPSRPFFHLRGLERTHGGESRLCPDCM